MAFVFARVSHTVRPVALTLVAPTPVTLVPGTVVFAVTYARKALPATCRPLTVKLVGSLAALGVIVTDPKAMFLQSGALVR